MANQKPPLAPFYLPIMAGPYSHRMSSAWHPECALEDLTIEGIVRDVCDGQFPYDSFDIERFLLVDPEKGTVTDATKDVAKAVARAVEDETYRRLRDWLDNFNLLERV